MNHDRMYQVYAGVCEEFPHQVAYVRVTFGSVEIFNIRPGKESSELQEVAVSFAREAATQLKWDNGSSDVIDYDDT